MKKRLSLLILILFSLSNVAIYADVIIDDSIHSEIEKEYELDKLPPLPQTSNNSSINSNSNNSNDNNSNKNKKTIQSVPIKYSNKKTNTTNSQKKEEINEKKETQQTQSSKPNKVITSQIENDNNKSIKLNKGKTFDVKLLNTISSKSKIGTNISFASVKPQTFKYVTIPVGTMFYGKITNAHSAQLTGNGGLIEIKVNSFKYKNKIYSIDAKVTLADDKHIFFNNIKGKRMYLKNMYKKTNYGRKTVKRTFRSSVRLTKDPYTLILSPFPICFGLVAYSVNAVLSPFLAIFTRGSDITIQKNARFKIKMLDDAYIY